MGSLLGLGQALNQLDRHGAGALVISGGPVGSLLNPRTGLGVRPSVIARLVRQLLTGTSAAPQPENSQQNDRYTNHERLQKIVGPSGRSQTGNSTPDGGGSTTMGLRGHV